MDKILIKKAGCALYTTMSKYLRYYKPGGYEIVEQEKEYDLGNMEYKELQELYAEKCDASPVGVSKVDLIERLNEVL